MKLQNNTILITGGASGIGLALTKLLYRQGNTIIVCGRNQARLAELKQQLPDIISYQCDLGDQNVLDAFTRTVIEQHPDLNILINNAGVQYNYLLGNEASHSECIREEFSVNLLAPVLLTERLLPVLRQHKQAAVINITSALAVAPKKNAAVYCASKAAMRSFTQALRYQLEGSNVAVIEVVPSLVDTAMTKGRGTNKLTAQALAEKACDAIAAGRHEVLIEKTKILYFLNRLAPSLARRIVKNS